LRGELDLAGVPTLAAHLRALRDRHERVRSISTNSSSST
jgi:hypothetical protein